jgi:dTDP-glucose 4,6-dehydratase
MMGAGPALRRVLVTGGAGFIGAALCRRLVLEVGAEVLNVDCLTYAADQRRLSALAHTSKHRERRLDIVDLPAMAAVISEFEPDTIMHLAAESHVDRSINEAAHFIETNVVGTYSLLEAARQYWARLSSEAAADFRFLHVSTDEVYGSLGSSGFFTNETRYDPRSPYSASKAASDHLARVWQHTHCLPVIVTNCSNNYGPFQFPEKLIPLMILKAIAGEPLPVYGDGHNVRDWIHVDDHTQALVDIALRGQPGSTYVVGARTERTNLEIVRHICSVLDVRRPQGRPHSDLIAFVKDRPGHDQRYAIDPTRTEQEIGWHARISFDRGLEETVAWYLENEEWWAPLQARYSGQRLGLGLPGSRRASM